VEQEGRKFLSPTLILPLSSLQNPSPPCGREQEKGGALSPNPPPSLLSQILPLPLGGGGYRWGRGFLINPLLVFLPLKKGEEIGEGCCP